MTTTPITDQLEEYPPAGATHGRDHAGAALQRAEAHADWAEKGLDELTSYAVTTDEDDAGLIHAAVTAMATTAQVHATLANAWAMIAVAHEEHV